MLSTKFKILFVFIVIFLLLIAIILQKYSLIKINDSIFIVEIVKTDVQKIKGLSDRDALGNNRGMIFVFDEPGIYNFWMKNMKFPIDIIWLRDNKIVGFVENAQPDNSLNPAIYSPPELITRALEIPAGSVEKLKINVLK